MKKKKQNKTKNKKHKKNNKYKTKQKNKVVCTLPVIHTVIVEFGLIGSLSARQVILYNQFWYSDVINVG